MSIYNDGNISEVYYCDAGALVPISEIYNGSDLVYSAFKSQTITFTAQDAFQEFIVPRGCTKLQVDCVASKGMNGRASGGKGGRVQCILSVTPNQTLYIMVGIVPTANNNNTYNASDIRTDNTGITDTTSLQSRLVVAGGGGNSRSSGGAGGAGGGTTGANGSTYDNGGGGKGGTQSAGGNGGSAGVYGSSGAKGSFGLGGQKVGGAGGAGWYGGGSGGSKSYVQTSYGGGGGGSSYTDSTLCTDVVHTQGYQDGAGYITITTLKGE